MASDKLHRKYSKKVIKEEIIRIKFEIQQKPGHDARQEGAQAREPVLLAAFQQQDQPHHRRRAQRVVVQRDGIGQHERGDDRQRGHRDPVRFRHARPPPQPDVEKPAGEAGKHKHQHICQIDRAEVAAVQIPHAEALQHPPPRDRAERQQGRLVPVKMPVAFALVRRLEDRIVDDERAAFQHGFHHGIPRRLIPGMGHVVLRQKECECGRNDQENQETKSHGGGRKSR